MNFPKNSGCLPQWFGRSLVGPHHRLLRLLHCLALWLASRSGGAPRRIRHNGRLHRLRIRRRSGIDEAILSSDLPRARSFRR
ncbi:MAG: hypothetical protein K6T61_06435 [Bryobacteraceae bacterium]|nr:hypothetical protein [Bryobacteraceae bacterium]